ncbi:MAG: LamG domain-containing protein [Phycisphaera sp.]|nr:MAG: LamG domain-containing protein [Phycisphaera sp.]
MPRIQDLVAPPAVPTARLLAAAGLLACAASALGQGADPILHYDFDDGLRPTANLGTLGPAYDGQIGGGIEFVPFMGGLALGFDSTGDGQVRPLGDEDAFDLADGDFSIAVTVVTSNTEPGAEGGRFVVNKEKSGSDDGWALTVRRDDGVATFSISADGVLGVGLRSVTPVNDGRAHEVVAVRVDDRLAMAIDGVIEAVVRIPAGFGSTAQNDFELSIGGRGRFSGSPTTGANDEFLGTIDQVRIYDTAIIRPCDADCDLSGSLDLFDFLCFQNLFDAGDLAADLDGDGSLTLFDFLAFQNAFDAGCP